MVTLYCSYQMVHMLTPMQLLLEQPVQLDLKDHKVSLDQLAQLAQLDQLVLWEQAL
jgi:hypothetical protein